MLYTYYYSVLCTLFCSLLFLCIMQFFVDNCSLYNTESLRVFAKINHVFTCILLKDVLKWKISRYISKDGLNSASYIKDSGNWYIAEQQNPLFSPIWEEPKMELSPNVTISNELFEGERMIWLQYRRQPREKNISFSVNKWILLLTHLQEIKEFLTRVLTQDAPAKKTWDLIPEGRGGNKRVTVKRFASGTTIIDFRIFNFHVKPELHTKYGLFLNQ